MKFLTEMKSCTGLSSFRLSCERTLKNRFSRVDAERKSKQSSLGCLVHGGDLNNWGGDGSENI